ncbi:hypothetical protein HRR90_003952 [Exophiala dermatitidis]|nr:hypothetical protein HRR90_003952 [Exophiala dermatitidis]
MERMEEEEEARFYFYFFSSFTLFSFLPGKQPPVFYRHPSFFRCCRATTRFLVSLNLSQKTKAPPLQRQASLESGNHIRPHIKRNPIVRLTLMTKCAELHKDERDEVLTRG